MKNRQQNRPSQRQRMLADAFMADMIHQAIRFIIPNADELYDLSREVVVLDRSSYPPLPEGIKEEDILAAVAAKVYRKDGTREVLFLSIQL